MLPGGVRVHEQLLRPLLFVVPVLVGCRPSVAATQPQQAVGPARVEPAFDAASTIWTAERAADPELLHLHVQAAAAPGAFVVPWLEGVTFRPCALRVDEGDATLQSAELAYDDEGRLTGITVDGETQALERDDDGRLIRGHGFEYQWGEQRVETVVEADARVHVLQYDEDGRLIGIESALTDEAPLRRHVLEYDEEARLAVRRFTGASGEHGVTHFVYDEQGRLVRIDVEFTDPQGVQQRQPAVRLEYEGSRLVEFGPARITYDDAGHVASLAADSTVTRYDYQCL